MPGCRPALPGQVRGGDVVNLQGEARHDGLRRRGRGEGVRVRPGRQLRLLLRARHALVPEDRLSAVGYVLLPRVELRLPADGLRPGGVRSPDGTRLRAVHEETEQTWGSSWMYRE